jgi:hypothetical protein
VSESNQHKGIGSIESAMDRLAEDKTAKAPTPRTRSVGRRDYDHLLSRRLEQLNNAMSSGAEPEISPAIEKPPSTIAAPTRTFGIQAIVVTALFSSLVGAGAMQLIQGKTTTIPEPVAVAKPAPAPAAIPPIAAPAQAIPLPEPTSPAIKTDEAGVQELVEQWRLAWANRDSDAYLNFYSTNFIPADGSTRSNWAIARRKNLSSRPDINVVVRELQITLIDEKQLKLVFQQDYASGNFRENDKTKTLLVVQEGNVWRITGEWMGDHPVTGK